MATSAIQILSFVVPKLPKEPLQTSNFFPVLELAVSNQGCVFFQSFALTTHLFFGTLRTLLLWPACLFTNKIHLAKPVIAFPFTADIAYMCSFWSAEQITATWRSQNINSFCHCYHSYYDRSSGGLDKDCGHINRERQCFGHKPGANCTVPALIKQTDYVLLKAQKARKTSLEMALKNKGKLPQFVQG